MAAIQRLYDLFWVDKVCDWNFSRQPNEYNDFTRGWVSTELDGAWTIGVQQDCHEGAEDRRLCDPLLPGAKRNWNYPDELAC